MMSHDAALVLTPVRAAAMFRASVARQETTLLNGVPGLVYGAHVSISKDGTTLWTRKPCGKGDAPAEKTLRGIKGFKEFENAWTSPPARAVLFVVSPTSIVETQANKSSYALIAVPARAPDGSGWELVGSDVSAVVLPLGGFQMQSEGVWTGIIPICKMLLTSLFSCTNPTVYLFSDETSDPDNMIDALGVHETDGVDMNQMRRAMTLFRGFKAVQRLESGAPMDEEEEDDKAEVTAWLRSVAPEPETEPEPKPEPELVSGGGGGGGGGSGSGSGVKSAHVAPGPTIAPLCDAIAPIGGPLARASHHIETNPHVLHLFADVIADVRRHDIMGALETTHRAASSWARHGQPDVPAVHELHRALMDHHERALRACEQEE